MTFFGDSAKYSATVDDALSTFKLIRCSSYGFSMAVHFSSCSTNSVIASLPSESTEFALAGFQIGSNKTIQIQEASNIIKV